MKITDKLTASELLQVLFAKQEIRMKLSFIYGLTSVELNTWPKEELAKEYLEMCKCLEMCFQEIDRLEEHIDDLNEQIMLLDGGINENGQD